MGRARAEARAVDYASVGVPLPSFLSEAKIGMQKPDSTAGFDP